jgi:hypothetical protein
MHSYLKDHFFGLCRNFLIAKFYQTGVWLWKEDLHTYDVYFLFSAMFSWIYSSEFQIFVSLQKSKMWKMVLLFCGRSQGRTQATISFWTQVKLYKTVGSFRIRVRRIEKFLTSQSRIHWSDPNPSIIEQK